MSEPGGDLAEQVRYLRDIHEIKQLKARYCELSDAVIRDPKVAAKLSLLFTEDAMVDVGVAGELFAAGTRSKSSLARRRQPWSPGHGTSPQIRSLRSRTITRAVGGPCLNW
jgi:SnoaL-like domain